MHKAVFCAVLLSSAAIIVGMGAVQATESDDTAIDVAAPSAVVFKSVFQFNNADGAYPVPGLTRDPSAKVYYGATYSGGTTNANCNNTGCGVAYALTPASGGTWTQTIIHKFSGGNGGWIPYLPKFLNGSQVLYGAAEAGGSANCSSGCGLVYTLTRPSGGATWKTTVLHRFAGPPVDGSYPLSSLVRSKTGALLGFTVRGGHTAEGGRCTSFRDGCGTVFELIPPKSGTKWTRKLVHQFSGGADGALPSATGLVGDAAGNFYGMTNAGGNVHCKSPYQAAQAGCGVVFMLAPKGAGWTFSVLHTFHDTTTDGNTPNGAPLFLGKDGALYGTTSFGGSKGAGVIFKLTPPKTGTKWTFQLLYSFRDGADGNRPSGGVVMDNKGVIYATASAGGTTNAACSSGCGTIVKLTQVAEKWKVTVLRKFNGTDGDTPVGPLLLDGATIIGATRNGGTVKKCTDIYGQKAGCGNIFTLKP
jgi:uncharacterized repeat protein (TIGR03803 family)